MSDLTRGAGDGASPTEAAARAHGHDAYVVGAPCLNCEAPLHGPYCAMCGQPVRDPDPTAHDLVHDAVHEFLHVDGKIFTTLRLLLTRPGALTRAFLAGRRARYVGPLRLYLTASLLFFGVRAMLPRIDPGERFTPIQLDLGRGEGGDHVPAPRPRASRASASVRQDPPPSCRGL